MQKIFIRYTFFIVTSAILLIFVINFLYTMHTLESQQFQSFETKIEQVIHTLENNQAELEIMNQNLDEDYLTRAKAAAYVMDRQEEVSKSVAEMQALAKLLNVDELHVIDENGIIISASVSQYVGFDMAAHEQTRPFLALLECEEEGAYLIQDMQPNAAENKIRQYVGVARKGQKGVVQVGFEPTRQLEARSRNTCEYIFSKFPTDMGEELFAIDCETGNVIGHSGGIKQNFSEPCYQLSRLSDCSKGIYMEGPQGQEMYVTGQTYENILICAMLPREVLTQQLLNHVGSTLLYLLLIEALVLLLLNHLVKRKAVDGIHQILENLSAITNGRLDTTVAVLGNPEFEKLSQGINAMVKSIVQSSDRISAIIENSGVPLAAFEFENDQEHLFVTSGLRELLEISDGLAEELYQNTALFEQYIRNLTVHPLDGEDNIYQISEQKFVRIHMSESPRGSLGVITDVSKDILAKRKMQFENTHDGLTGLYKFRAFKELAAERVQKLPKGQVCAVVMLDLDNFKRINDNFGHDTGDRYLQGFAAVMHAMPQAHFLNARRSGDEFCMMIYGCESQEEIARYLDVFYETLERMPVALSDELEQTISASAGYAWTEDCQIGIAELLGRADEALYEVKKDTKGNYTKYQV